MSLLLAPLVNGAVMEAFGQQREGRGRRRLYLATFWGGALFAFSVALARFLLIQP